MRLDRKVIINYFVFLINRDTAGRGSLGVTLLLPNQVVPGLSPGQGHGCFVLPILFVLH